MHQWRAPPPRWCGEVSNPPTGDITRLRRDLSSRLTCKRPRPSDRGPSPTVWFHKFGGRGGGETAQRERERGGGSSRGCPQGGDAGSADLPRIFTRINTCILMVRMYCTMPAHQILCLILWAIEGAELRRITDIQLVILSVVSVKKSFFARIQPVTSPYSSAHE